MPKDQSDFKKFFDALLEAIRSYNDIQRIEKGKTPNTGHWYYPYDFEKKNLTRPHIHVGDDFFGVDGKTFIQKSIFKQSQFDDLILRVQDLKPQTNASRDVITILKNAYSIYLKTACRQEQKNLKNDSSEDDSNYCEKKQGDKLSKQIERLSLIRRQERNNNMRKTSNRTRIIIDQQSPRLFRRKITNKLIRSTLIFFEENRLRGQKKICQLSCSCCSGAMMLQVAEQVMEKCASQLPDQFMEIWFEFNE